MRRELLPLLACPSCRDAGLRLEVGCDGDEETIRAGKLSCKECARIFPVEDGVAVLLLEGHSEPVQQAFSNQWHLRMDGNFEPSPQIYCLSHESRADDLVRKLGGALDGQSAGEWILDAGCGTGELIRALAQRYPDVNFVGIDFTDTLKAVARARQGLPNLDFVQGDVSSAPFLAKRFRAVISLGVLHHTPETRTAFAEVARLVQPGGKLSVWLYPHPSELHLLDRNSRRSIAWYYRLRDWVFLRRAHLVPQKLLFWMLRILLAPVFVVPIPNIPPYTDTTRRKLHASLVFVLFDGLVPEFQHRHTNREVKGWFTEEGLVQVEAGPPTVESSHSLGAFTGTKILENSGQLPGLGTQRLS